MCLRAVLWVPLVAFCASVVSIALLFLVGAAKALLVPDARALSPLSGSQPVTAWRPFVQAEPYLAASLVCISTADAGHTLPPFLSAQ